MAYGGSLHPDADADDSLREELAAMTASATWVRSHVFIAIGTVLLAFGLWSAYRKRSWPTSTRRTLRFAAIAMSFYVVETVFHLASAIDSDALAEGDPAPIAFTHIGLAVVLYPISGLAFAWLNVRLSHVLDLRRTPLLAVGVVAGILHAVSVPLTLALPDTEFTAVFAGAGMLLAIWSLGFGLLGIKAARPATAEWSSASDAVTGGPAAVEEPPVRDVLLRATPTSFSRRDVEIGRSVTSR